MASVSLKVREDTAVVTSRDGYNRNRPPRGSYSDPQRSQPQGSGLEMDPGEINRFLAGKPSREPRFDPYGRPQTSGRTEPYSAPRYEQAEPEYPENASTRDNDFGYEDYEADNRYDYQPLTPSPQQRYPDNPRSRTAPRQQTYRPEPEYEDGLYDDPYLEEEEDRPRRETRRPRTAAPARRPRQAPTFTVPPAIAEAAIVKDRTTLIMLVVNIASVLVMFIMVAARKSSMSEVIVTRIDANGNPAMMMTLDAVWQLPVIGLMVLLINGVLAWFLARWEMFLPRFLLGGALAIQFAVWAALITFLF